MDLITLKKKFKQQYNFLKIFNHNKKAKQEFQRLEFLGDRVLALILSHEIYNRFTRLNEGRLATIFSYLTSSATLSKIAKEIQLDLFIKKKKFNNISDKVLSDFIEAILGSLYIDSGIDVVRSLIVELWMEEIIKNRDLRRDAKSVLQEWTQANGLGLPVYKVLKKKGLDHQPTFEIKLIVKDFDVILGNGKSLQIAQKKTAEKFIKKFIEEDIIVKQ